MPDLDVMLGESNRLLVAIGLHPCSYLEPMADGDTANPACIGHSSERKYVIKAVFRHPDTLAGQLRAANWFREHREIPVPEHYCHGDDESLLPLMVMQWLPGEQLRLALPTATSTEANAIARDWGRCLAMMHTSSPTDDCLTSRSATPGSYWWDDEQYAGALKRIEQLDGLDAQSRERMRQFIKDRRGSYADVQPAIVKADSDTRDFLAVTGSTPRISGMIDWERIGYGYSPYDSIVVYLRLVSQGRLDLWPHYRSGYEAAAGFQLRQTADVEYCFMCRGLNGAVNRLPAVSALLVEISKGRRISYAC